MAKDREIETIISENLDKPAFELGQEYGEIALDSFVDNDVLREIPIVKTVVGIGKGLVAVKNIYFAKKLLAFLEKFHTGNLPEDKLDDFKFKLNDDETYRQKVVEHVVVYNERFVSIKKSEVLANLFLAHLNGKFDWQGFEELSEIVDSVQIRAFEVLKNSADSDDPFHFVTADHQADGGGVLFSAGLCIIHGNHYSVNAYGRYLYYYGILGDINFEFPQQNQP